MAWTTILFDRLRGIIKESQAGSGTATDGYVLTATGTGTPAWEASAGGGGGGSLTVKKLDATGAVSSVTILRVAKLTNNTGGDVSLLPQIIGTGTGQVNFDTTEVKVLSASAVNGVQVGTFGRIYMYSEGTPGNLNGNGVQIEVGNDYVGLIIGEKNSSTIQIYDDSGGSYDIEFVEQDDSFHFKFIHVDGGIAIPALGMPPRYSSEPHSGDEQAGESYYDTTLDKTRTWDGSAWQDHW